MVDRTVRVVLQGDATSLVEAANRGRTALNELGRADVSGAHNGIRNAGVAATESTTAFERMKASMASQVGIGNIMAMGMMSAFFAVKTAITDTVRAGTDYQTTMYTLQAVTHASDTEMVRFGDTARALGKDITIPNASATDAAKAMTELAKGGLSVGASMTAAKGTLLLAAAATVSASTAAEVEVNVLNAFNLSADQAGRVADVLANAANQASGDMMDFSHGLQMVGTTAHGFGMSLEETTTVLGLFANAGIKSEMGGTLLNTMLVRLAAPTKQGSEALKDLGVTTFDASGKFEGMRAVTDQLRTAHETLTAAAYANAASIAFGTRGIRGAMILGGEAASAYGIMSDSLTHQGGAAELAAAKMQGLGGAFQNLANQVQDFQLMIFGALAPSLQAVVTGLADTVGGVAGAITWFTNLPAPIVGITTALGGVLLLSGPLNAFWLMMKTNVVSAVETMRLQMMIAGDTLRGFELTMAGVKAAAVGLWTALGGPIGVAILGITTALSFMAGGTSDAAAATSDFTDAIDKNTGALSGNSAAAIAKSVADSGSVDKYAAIGGSVQDYTAALVGNAAAQDRVHTTIQKAAEAAVVQDGQFKATGMTVQEYATSVLASGMASNMSNDAMNAAGAASKAFAHDADVLTTQQNKVKEAIAGAGSAADSGAGSQSALNAAIKAGADPAATMNAALKDFKTQADFANTAGQYLWATLQDLSGHQIDAEHQTRLTAAAFRDMESSARAVADANAQVTSKTTALNDAVAKYGKDSPQVAQAQRDLAGATDNVAKASDTQADSITKAAQAAIDAAGRAYALKAATGVLSGAVADATAATESGRKTFIKTAEQMGYNEIDANALADKYHLIPGEVVTAIQASGMPKALADADALNQKLSALDKKLITYTVVGSTVVQYTTSNAGGVSSTDQYLAQQAAAGGHAEGGWITGAGGPKDDKVKAALSPHEFVVNAAQAIKHGALLEAINNGTMGFAAGGAVPDAATPGATKPVAAVASVAASAVALPDVAAFQAAWLAIAKAVQDAWAVTINPTLLLLAAGEAATSTEFLSLAKDAVEPSWAANSAAITASVDTIILPTYEALNGGTNNVATTVANAANAWIIPTFGNMTEYIRNSVFGSIIPTYDAWNAGTTNLAAVQVWLRDQNVIPVWQGIWQGIANVWGHLQGVEFPQFTQGLANLGSANQQLQGNTESTWSAIGSTISNTFNGQIVPAWNGVQNFTSAMGGFFGGINAGMGSATAESKSDVSQITSAINDFFTMVAGKTAGQPAAAPPATVGAADGGMITSGTGPRTDDVAIRVSKGEYVVNAASTAKHKSTLDSINYGGAYADGGVVGDKISTNVHDAMMSGTEKAVEAGVAKVMTAMAATGGAGIVFNGQLSVGGDTVPLPAGARGKFMQAVASKMGTSYVWGAAGPDVFDCSGLMSWGLDQAGASAGRLTAEGFNEAFAHIGQAQPGDLVTFDTGRLPGQAGHIGAVLDVGKGLMMQTDGSGPAKVAGYVGRDGGPLSILDPFGGSGGGGGAPASASAAGGGDPPSGGWLGSILARIKAGTTAAGNVSYAVGAGVEQWRGLVDQSLQILGQPITLDSVVLHQMDTESSGNPNAINLTDSNAQRGTPSKGLVQVIDPTFASFAIPPYNTNIWDPLSNILAGENYAIHQYGSLAAGMRGVAYDGGGMWPSGTAGVNLTGKKEAVLAPDETKAYKSHAAALAAGFGGQVLPPQASHFAPVVNVAAPNVTVYLDDFSANVRVEVDGAIANVARVLTRSGGQG